MKLSYKAAQANVADTTGATRLVLLATISLAMVAMSLVYASAV